MLQEEPYKQHRLNFVALLGEVDWSTAAGPDIVLHEMRKLLGLSRAEVNRTEWRAVFASAAAHFVAPYTLSAVDRPVRGGAVDPLFVLATRRGVPELAAHILAEPDFDPHAGFMLEWAIILLDSASLAALVQSVHRRCGARFNPDHKLPEGAVRVLLSRHYAGPTVADCVTALLDAGAAPVWPTPVNVQVVQPLYTYPPRGPATAVKSVGNLVHAFDKHAQWLSAHIAQPVSSSISAEVAAAWTGAMRLWPDRGAWLRSCRVLVDAATVDCAANVLLTTVLGDGRLCITPCDDMPYRVPSELASLVALFL